jgi:hypothetical protein
MKLHSNYEFIKQFSKFEANSIQSNFLNIKDDLEDFLNESDTDYHSFIPCEKLAILDILHNNFTWRLSDTNIKLESINTNQVLEIVDLILGYIELNEYDIEFLCMAKLNVYETSAFLSRPRETMDINEESTFEFLREHINNYYLTQTPVFK